MLVISRKSGEELVIGDSIVIRVERTGSNRVKLAIQAPPHVPIRRDSECAPPPRAVAASH
ncbi:carbon storage regulator [Stratiformator vulcanicus]|uniref:Carbon storage regulator n=1 Tax=Stratiformator vulcanicus TaxID=2527980 RepID=A0A517R396_9PLAN|nr:carbon storage regulator [Stratiformator vulcanicus]